MTKARKIAISNAITYGLVIVAYLVCSYLADNKIMSRSLRGQLVPICVYVVMAVSLNLTVGISGELSLGHAGFMSVGAFSGIVVSTWLLSAFQMENEVIRLVIAMVVGGVFAGIAGVLIGIPVLRLRGDYLAIVTLAFGEIIRNVLNCLYFSVDGSKLHISFNNPMLPGTVFVKGPAGATGVDKCSTFLMGALLILFTLVIVLNLTNSRSGRAIMAIRDSRIAAESVGLNITKYKMMAFVTSAALAGMAGALYGLNFSTVTASQFKFDKSIEVLVFVVLGGIGNIRGSIIAASLLTILPELLRAFSDYRMLVYAIVLILVMLATNSSLLKNLWRFRGWVAAVLLAILEPVLVHNLGQDYGLMVYIIVVLVTLLIVSNKLRRGLWALLMRIKPFARLVNAITGLVKDKIPFKKNAGKEGGAA